MSDFTEASKRIYRIASLNAHEYEPWDGYYLTRIVELEIISDLLDLKEWHTVLEIGCGNGFYSALLSPHVKRVYGGDLETPNTNTHTMGIAKAKGLLKKLNISRVNLSSFSGTELPFRSESFNLVFTSSTLEHILDRKNAVSEIKRVLKPGGKAVIIVPNFITSIYSIIHLPLYLCMAIFRRLFKKKISKGLPNGVFKKQERMNVFTMLGNALIPKPHGEYKNIFDELQNTYPAKWERLLTEGGMKVLSSRGTIILPWSLISVFSSHFGALLYGLTKGFHKTIVSKYDFFKYFSYLICIVARK
jgi:SAM-dependent methyltransferase